MTVLSHDEVEDIRWRYDSHTDVYRLVLSHEELRDSEERASKTLGALALGVVATIAEGGTLADVVGVVDRIAGRHNIDGQLADRAAAKATSGEITCMSDFARRLAADAELIIAAHPTTFTDARVAEALHRIVHAAEGALVDERVISREQPAVDPTPADRKGLVVPRTPGGQR